MRFVLGGLAVSLALACGGGNKPAAKQPDPVTAEPTPTALGAVNEAVELFLDLGKTVMAAGGDCDLMATEVRKWIDANATRRAWNNKALARVRSEKLKQHYRNRLAEKLDVVMGLKAGLDGCRTHARFMAAWGRLDR